MEEERYLFPNWEIGEKLIYQVTKIETFDYSGSKTPPFERSFPLELTLMEDNIIEAYYPNSILSAIKLLNAAEPFFSKISTVQTNSIYYEVDENFQFLDLKNIDDLLNSLTDIKNQIEALIKDDEDDVLFNLEWLIDLPNKAGEYFRSELETMHDFYGTAIRDGYYVDLIKPPSKAKAFGKKLLGMVNLNFGKIHLVQTDFINDDIYQIELLKGQDTVSTKTRQDFEAMKEEFIANEFEIRKYNDITLHHQKYFYDTEHFILKKYEYTMFIDTPKMRKDIYTKIELKSFQ